MRKVKVTRVVEGGMSICKFDGWRYSLGVHSLGDQCRVENIVGTFDHEFLACFELGN